MKKFIFKYPIISSIIICVITIAITFIALSPIMPTSIDCQMQTI